MQPNPYEAPRTTPAIAPAKIVAWHSLLKGIGGACWLIGALWSAVGVVAMSLTTESLFRGTPGALAFYSAWVIAFPLPIIGLALFGARCWRRSARLAVFGLTPIVTAVVIVVGLIKSN